MGLIMQNGISYGGVDIVKLTQAEYDALPESKNSDGILYAITDGEGSSGGTSKPVELTKAQYEALGESTKTDGILYAITDGDELSAKNMAYDGSVTGLGNNVQSAIDELNSNMSGEEFGYNDNGDFCHRQVGADTWIPFKNLAKDTPATATADMLTEGFTAWVNGELITGTRPQAPNTLSGSGSTWKDWDQMTMTGSVTFSTPFDTIPTVSAYVSYAHDGGYGVTGRFSMRVSNVTRSGFNWKITTSSWEKPAAITFAWTAKTA